MGFWPQFWHVVGQVVMWIAGVAAGFVVNRMRGYKWHHLWYGYVLLSWLMTIIAFAAMPVNPNTYLTICPACLEAIPKGAIRCPHCTTILPDNLGQ